jgi:THAP domain-containing protein 1/3
MPNKCSAYGCKSGYDGHKNESRVSFHSFPLDSDLCDKWIRANPRKDFKPSKHSRLCSLHFRECDFVEEHFDSNLRRKYSTDKLDKRYLKKDAVPSYLTTPLSTPRASAASARTFGRQQQEAERLDALQELFETQERLQLLTPSQIKDKLTTETAVPSGFQIVQ